MSEKKIKDVEDYPERIKKLFEMLKYNNQKIIVIGSASLKGQKYFSDYDLKTFIVKHPNMASEAYEQFSKIITKIENYKNIYITELKLEKLKGDSIKWTPDQPFDQERFYNNFDINNIDFFKIDLIVKIGHILNDVNIVYKFVDEPVDLSEKKMSEKEIEDLKKAVVDYEKDKNYYKALKRKYSIYSDANDKEKIDILNKLFNSEIGKLYRTKSILSTILNFQKYYKDDESNKMVDETLKHIKEIKYKNNLEGRIKDIDKTINKLTENIEKDPLFKI